MSGWAVVYLPDANLNVRAVGPFRARERARAVCDKLTAVSPQADDAPDVLVTVIPQVVELQSLHEALNSGDFYDEPVPLRGGEEENK